MATMVVSVDDFLYWSPRVLGLGVVGLLMLLSADAFEAAADARTALTAFLIHLIPAALVLCLLAVAWRREWIGATVFPLLGLLYVVATWGRFTLAAYLALPGTLLVTGLLFLADWRRRQRDTARR